MIKLYLVRHGETNWNEKGKTQGSSDIPLNDKGIEQANKLKSKIDYRNIDLCFVSPLIRAKTTAEILLKNTHIDKIYDDRLVERNFGDFEGTKISNEDVLKLWDYNNLYTDNNVESLKDSLNRASNFLEYLKENFDNNNILIVSHACLIKCLHYNLLGYDENTDFMDFFPKNADVYEYELNSN